MNRLLPSGLGRTVLFSVGVVTFVIGVYQTLVENNPKVPLESLQRNYWLFMISLACVMYYRYLRPREKEQDFRANHPEPPKKAGRGPKAVPRNKRRN